MAVTTIKDRVTGCLVGGAVGDALGYAVEFIDYDRIIQRYGVPGIIRYSLNLKGEAEISDDTQMTLYTANGLLIGDIPTAYLEWYHTQTSTPDTLRNPRCWLSGIPAMYSLRAPGNTCLGALRAMRQGRQPQNNSKGCGGIMRVAPIGIYNAVHGIDPDHTSKEAAEAARLTHLHPLGWAPAGILAYTVQRILVDGCDSREVLIRYFLDALDSVNKVCTVPVVDYEEMLRGISLAVALSNASDSVTDEQHIRRLGQGWVGEEALYIAVYCSLRHFDSFEDAIVAAVNHSGDSDSTGAVTGNIMGAIHGYSGIPRHYTDHLELLDVIQRMAKEMTNDE